MIRMTKGTYGLKTDRGVEAMTKHSAPFSLSEKREEELIKAGVAVKADPPAARRRRGTKAEIQKDEESHEI